DDAAVDALAHYNPYSTQENREYAGLIYEWLGHFFATPGYPGGICNPNCSSNPYAAIGDVPNHAIIIGYYHTHGGHHAPDLLNAGIYTFSRGDIRVTNQHGPYQFAYMANPFDRVFRYDSGTLPD
ncbi:unnamed protein product, partial [Ectocarpus fasciculatus]